ncbi:MAG: CoA-transferase [Pseudomonadota bacterium]
MLDKRMSLAAMVAELRDGMTIGIGGWGARRKPMALVRELLRSSLKDLTVVSYGGPDVGMLLSAGKIRKLVFGFVSLDLIPLDPHFRQARQAGSFEAWEIDEGMLQWGLRAAAARLPFLPTRLGLASDIVRRAAGLKMVRSPYDDDEEFVAMPALRLDAALLHVNEADVAGNTLILSADPFFDDLFGRAADRTFVTCERLVPTQAICSIERARYNPFERSVVTGVAEVPLGAHPTANGPDYGIDLAHLTTYGAAITPQGWAQYRQQFVDLPDHEAYLSAAGGRAQLAAIALPVF